MSYWRFIPNCITLLRFAAVPLLIWWLLDSQFYNALLLCLAMGLSDALDGYLARMFNWKTPLGASLDPAADKCMLISTCVTLGTLDLLPYWLVIIVIMRDVVLFSRTLSYVLSVGRLDIQPSMLGKLNTFVQIILVLAVIYAQIGVMPVILIQTLMGLTLFTTIASTYEEWNRRIERHSGKQA